MKYFRQIRSLGTVLSLALTVLAFSATAKPVFAEGQLGSTHSQTLTIIKYGLRPNSKGFSTSQTSNDGLKINNLPLDDQGQELMPLAGISYQIQKIAPTGSGNDISLTQPASYCLLCPPEMMTTGGNGTASMVLIDGFYIISEKVNPSAHLVKAAPPVLLRLPVVNPTKDGYLDQVTLYPKSSVDSEVSPTKVEEVNLRLPSAGDKNVTEISLLGAILLASAGIIVVRLRYRRKYN